MSFSPAKIPPEMNNPAASGRDILIKCDFKKRGKPLEIKPTCGI